jgi:hypothetical protein
MATLVDTAVAPHRKLRFHSIEDALAEVDRILAAEQSGKLSTTGNWTPGQAMGHVAAWINYSYEGYPLGPPPWFVRFILKRMVKKYMRKGMPTGRRIPGVDNGTYGVEPMSTVEGAEKLKKALKRLASDEPARFDSPAFGSMPHADRIQLNLRHAELHLGFLRY